MSAKKDDEKNLGASVLREAAAGSLSEDTSHIGKHAGLIDDDDLRTVFWFLESVYDPSYSSEHDDMPTNFWETDTAKRILRRYGTNTATKALKTGNSQLIEFLSGLPNYRGDASAVDSLVWLSDWLNRTAGITIISGHMGSGKTSFALLCAELMQKLSDQGDKPTLITNIMTCEDADVNTQKISKIKEISQRNDSERCVVIIDEASSHFSGYASDRADVEGNIRRFLRMIRKNKTSLILIGHNRAATDIHPDVVRLANGVFKESKKKADFFEEISTKNGREYGQKIRSLDSIPDTGYEYDDLEETDLVWDDDDGSDDDDDESDDDKRQKPYPDDGGRCRGVKSNGDRCGESRESMLNSDGFCGHHQHQKSWIER